MTLVSAIMPTRSRREYASAAVDCFLMQTYGRRELVILDDADDRSFPDGIDHPLIRYHLMEERLTIPVKRNRCCLAARGSIIWTLDSDDWSSPERMVEQVRLLESSGLAMTGYADLLFVDTRTEPATAYKYVGESHKAVGTSLCYLRSWWESHPWNEQKRLASDVEYAREAVRANQMAASPDLGRIVARVHNDNSSPKNVDRYDPIGMDAIPAAFLAS
jgi:O-antigen biosynthesis protein